MAKKKSERKSKTFTEALGLNNIINDKTGFVVGLILLCVAIYICVAFFSYFNTGAADQSLVTDLRPGEVENANRAFQNTCGSLGALLSYGLISRCFGIPAFIIPAFYCIVWYPNDGCLQEAKSYEMVHGNGFGDDMVVCNLCESPYSTDGQPSI